MEFLESDNRNNDEIIQLFRETFTESEGKEEGETVAIITRDLLKETGNIRIFIARNFEKITACVIFSKFVFENNKTKAYLLSPMAVLPDFQGKGIGQKLISFGHDELKKEDVQLVVTYGDINFYNRVGYEEISEDIVRAPLKLSYPEGWLGQSLLNESIVPIQSNTFCVEALNNQAYW